MVIFLDVDGTVAAPLEAPPQRMRSLLASLDEAGIWQVLCSGKSHEYLSGLARGLGLRQCSTVVAENGAIAFDWRTLELQRLSASPVDLNALASILTERLLRPDQFYRETKLGSLTFLPHNGDAGRTGSLMGQIGDILDKRGKGLNMYLHSDGGLDIVPVDVSKGRALRWLLDRWGVAEEEVITCGDGLTDLSMLELGYPVTFADAAPEVIALVQRRKGFIASSAGPDGLLEAFAWLMATNRLSVSPNKVPLAYRPWGSWEVLANGTGFKVKQMVVQPGHRLSLQQHKHRAEHWFLFGGQACVICGEKTLSLAEGETITVPVGVPHRVENRGQSPLIIIEIQIGQHLSEDDIVRLADDYQRVQ